MAKQNLIVKLRVEHNYRSKRENPMCDGISNNRIRSTFELEISKILGVLHIEGPHYDTTIFNTIIRKNFLHVLKWEWLIDFLGRRVLKEWLWGTHIWNKQLVSDNICTQLKPCISCLYHAINCGFDMTVHFRNVQRK